MEMYRHSRSESDVIRRLQKLGFRGTMAYPDGFFQLVKYDGSSTILISQDCEQFRYYGPEGTATHESEELDAEEWYKQLLQAIYLPIIEPGMLIVYDPGYKVELGKVKRLSKDGTSAFVWYHSGDAAAYTRLEDLYPIKKEFVLQYRDMFENAYAIDDIIAKEGEEYEHGTQV